MERENALLNDADNANAGLSVAVCDLFVDSKQIVDHIGSTVTVPLTLQEYNYHDENECLTAKAGKHYISER